MVPEVITRRRLTLMDYEALPDDQDYEIIDGVLYVSPRARPGHQAAVTEFVVELSNHTRSRGLGRIVLDADLIIDDRNTYMSPDIMYFAGDRFVGIDRGDWIRIIPDLIVEVLSPGMEDYDRDVKRRTYAALGVPHYWLADWRAHTVAECVLQPSGRYQDRIHGPDGTFRPLLFPDLELDLAWIFR
jgi:Uma2 family endonuclease